MKRTIAYLVLFGLSTVIWMPLLMVAGNSLMGLSEIYDHFSPVLIGIGEKVKFSVFPQYPTLQPYVELLLDSPGFYHVFWNSCGQVSAILGGICIISVPAAWAFARFEFQGRRFLFSLYMILMVMPFQVTMVSEYLILDKLHMMNTHLAVVAPAVFSTLPVFIMAKLFGSISPAMMEAAQIDGAGEWQIFLRIGLPLGFPGLLSVLILCFLEYWNAMERPLTFLRDKALWPLSLYLPNITGEKVGVSFAASVITMMPPLLLFLAGQDYLEQGIAASGVKE